MHTMYWQVEFHHRPSSGGSLPPTDHLFDSVRKMLWDAASGNRNRKNRHLPRVRSVMVLDVERPVGVAWRDSAQLELEVSA